MTNTATQLYKGTLAAPATPVFRAVTSVAATAYTASQSVTLTLPAYSVGELVTFFMHVYQSGGTVATVDYSAFTTAGWTLVKATNTTSSFGDYHFYKVMLDTTATVSPAFIMPTAIGTGPIYLAESASYSTCDGVTVQMAVSNASTVTSTPLTALAAHNLPALYVVQGWVDNAGTSTVTIPTGFTSRFNNGSQVATSSANFIADLLYAVNTQAVTPPPWTASTGANGSGTTAYVLTNTGAGTPTTLFTATSKTIITSVSLVGSSPVTSGSPSSSGKVRLAMAGVDILRDFSVANGQTTQLSLNQVLNTSDTIQGCSDIGVVPIFISGVVVT